MGWREHMGNLRNVSNTAWAATFWVSFQKYTKSFQDEEKVVNQLLIQLPLFTFWKILKVMSSLTSKGCARYDEPPPCPPYPMLESISGENLLKSPPHACTFVPAIASITPQIHKNVGNFIVCLSIFTRTFGYFGYSCVQKELRVKLSLKAWADEIDSVNRKWQIENFVCCCRDIESLSRVEFK